MTVLLAVLRRPDPNPHHLIQLRSDSSKIAATVQGCLRFEPRRRVDSR